LSAFSVAHVVLSLDTGGQERVVAELACAQRALGHSVTAVALSPERAEGKRQIADQLRDRGATVCHVPKRDGFDPSLYPRLTALFWRMQVDLVHTHNPSPLIYGAPSARLAGARVVHTKHGEHHDSKRRLALRRTAARFADAFVAVSDNTAEYARHRRECAPGKLRVIRNGTDLSRFGRDPIARRRVRGELGIPDDAWVVGSIGRFVPEKDQAQLLRAVEPILSDGAVLLLVGGGKLESHLREIARASPMSGSIRVLGQRSDVPALLAAMDAFAISSVTEGLPIVLIEAMASELTIVSTAVGGIPQVIEDGKTGMLVAAGDQRALREALWHVKRDPDNARRLAEAARRAALADLSAGRMSQEYMTLYSSVLNHRGPWKTRSERS
jgi:glycosyltransferase involved in cell wall biosynthesis